MIEIKKGLEYAILVSELGINDELPNDVPIMKVPGYDKMFHVRPQYFVIIKYYYSIRLEI